MRVRRDLEATSAPRKIRRVDMKSIEELRDIAIRCRNGEKVDGNVYTKSAGQEFLYNEENGKTYKISGTFRVRVEEWNSPIPEDTATQEFPKEETPTPKEKKVKKVKEPRPDKEDITCPKCGKVWSRTKFMRKEVMECPECRGTAKSPRDESGKLITKVTATCETCGETFERSIYSPKLTKCPKCRGSKSRTRSGLPAVERTLTCAHCGKEFVVNKFQPYWTAEMGCPDCRKSMKKAKDKAKKSPIKGTPVPETQAS